MRSGRAGALPTSRLRSGQGTTLGSLRLETRTSESGVAAFLWAFGFRYSFGIRHSGFGIIQGLPGTRRSSTVIWKQSIGSWSEREPMDVRRPACRRSTRTYDAEQPAAFGGFRCMDERKSGRIRSGSTLDERWWVGRSLRVDRAQIERGPEKIVATPSAARSRLLGRFIGFGWLRNSVAKHRAR